MSVALVIHHAKRMGPTMLPSVACLIIAYFPTFSQKRHDFREKSLNIKCVLWISLQLLSEAFLILRRIERDIIKNVHVVVCSTGCSYQILMKIDFSERQYSEDPATGHLDTGFSRFPCVYKQTLRRFPTFPVATTCFSCSPPDLNLLVTNFIFCIHIK